MQIVIDIDEDTYRYMQSRCKYQNKGDKGLSKFEGAGVAIKNGTILSKGHGDLKDMGNLKYVFDLTREDTIYSGKDIERAIKSMKTIIEADKAESEE